MSSDAEGDEAGVDVDGIDAAVDLLEKNADEASKVGLGYKAMSEGEKDSEMSNIRTCAVQISFGCE